MKLAAWLDRPGAPQDYVFAGTIGVSRVTLYRFKRGDRIPSRTIMTRIYDATDGAVGPHDFYEMSTPQPAGAAA